MKKELKTVLIHISNKKELSVKNTLKRHTIHIDLKVKYLQKYYDKSPSSAYSEIKNYLLEHGFLSKKDSDYISKEPISNTEIAKVTTQMSLEFPWLHQCCTKFDTEEISDIQDIKYLLNQPYNLLAKQRRKSNKR